MKKLLFITILLTSGIWCNAQKDTIKVVTQIDTSGTFVIDTLRGTGWFELDLSGGGASAVKKVYINNNTLTRDNNPYAFTGLAGGKWEVIQSGNYVFVRVYGTTKRIKWKLVRLNL